MLIYRRTSLLESPAQTLVNTVNCVGVMGKGLAKAFRDREPAMFARYKDVCSTGQLEPGKLWLWRGTENWTLNFPTKIHWRQPSKLEWVEAGLHKFVSTYKEQGIKEISFPRLGCGNGNLDWEDVKPMMEGYLSNLDIPVYIHDFAKDIGIHEHLEAIHSELSSKDNLDVNFDSFLIFLHDLTRKHPSSFEDMSSKCSFTAKMDGDNGLKVETSLSSWHYDMEDLHGAWVALLRGLVTRDRIEWSKQGGGNFVITLLSLMPTARPIEIQRGVNSEIAVELKPSVRSTAQADGVGHQLALAWR